MSVTVDKCLQAWTNSLRQMNAKADIVFFGDSLTYYGDFASVFPDKVVCNLGLRGDTIQGMINRVEQVKMLEPKQVFLMAGINDVGFVSERKFEEVYKHLLDQISERCPYIELVVQSLLPVNSIYFGQLSCTNEQIVQANKTIQKITCQNGNEFINLYDLYVKNSQLNREMTTDGIHLKPDTYQLWYDSLACI